MKIKSDVPEKAQAYLKQLEGRLIDAVYQALKDAGLNAEAQAKAIIQKEAFDTGDLLRSVYSQVTVSPGKMQLVVAASSAHGLVVELGRKPGRFPNLDALAQWVGRKLVAQGVGTRVTMTFDQLKAAAKSNGKPATAQQKAFRLHLAVIYLVGRKIATKGIREKLIFKRLEQQTLDFFREELMKALSSIR